MKTELSADPLAASTATVFSTSAFVAELIAGLPARTPLDARAVLEEHPELTNHKSAMMELAYEEYCRWDELGMPVDPGEFAARFPTICRSLLRQIEVHSLFADEIGSAGTASERGWPKPGAGWLDFQLLEELGRGAFSRVYLARQPSLGERLVVVKATPLGPREAHTLGMLRHPHVAPVHSVQSDESMGLTAVCMPYLSRVSLFDLMDALYSAARPPARAADVLEAIKRLDAATDAAPEETTEAPWPRRWKFADAVLQIGVQLAQGLEHAHRQGVLHGDVKPSNVLVTSSGRALLLDFNLAICGDEPARAVTGTLPYMAPEQLRPVAFRGAAHEPAIDERTDVFSLGMTLFELFYGRPAFGTVPAESSRERIACRLLERQRLGPNVPAGKYGTAACAVGKIIARCLEFDPRRRPQSMAELATLLSAQLKTPNRIGRLLRGHRRLTLAAAMLASGLLLAMTGWQATRDPYPIRKWRQGEAAFQRGDDAQAVLNLTDALEHAPHLLEARLLRARAHLRRKDFLAAYADLKPLAREVSDGRAEAGLAHAFAAINSDYGMAAAHYKRAVEQGCCSAVIYNNLGFCLAEVGQLYDAEAALKKALLLDPQLAVAYHSLARVEFLMAMAERRIPSTGPISQAIKFGPPTGQLDLDAALLRRVFQFNDRRSRPLPIHRPGLRASEARPEPGLDSQAFSVDCQPESGPGGRPPLAKDGTNAALSDCLYAR